MGSPGPGVANLLSAVVNSAEEKLPIIYIGSERTLLARSSVRGGQFQCPRLTPTFDTLVKFSTILECPEQVDEVFQEAFRQATAGTPGPVYIAIPFEFLMSRQVLGFPPLKPPSQYRLPPQQAPQQAIEQAVTQLTNAKLPLLLVGAGVHTTRGHAELERLSDLLKCPVITSYGGRGVLPESHEQVLAFGLGPGLEASKQADVVLAIGTSIGEKLSFGSEKYFGAEDKQAWIHIDKDDTAISRNRHIDVPLLGDLKAILPQLCEALERQKTFREPQALSSWREANLVARQQLLQAAPDTHPIHPGRAMAEVRRVIPDDAVIVRDGGATAMWELAYFEQRSQDFLWTSKLGHVGVGLPYAIGAQLAVGPERPVCLITGDGAIGFNFMELETAVRNQLPIVIIVNYDQAWGLEKPAYLMSYGRTYEVEMAYSRLDKMAEALGAHGELCETTAEIAPAVERALASGKPALVQIITDPQVNALQLPNIELVNSWYGEKEVY